MRRGYILLEAMIGAALVATVLITLLGHVGEVSAESTRQAREMTAQQLAIREIEELRALPFASITTGARVAGVTPSGAGVRTLQVGNSRYQIRRVVTPGTEIVTTSGPITVSFRNVEVEVSFPEARAGRRSVFARTRIYLERACSGEASP